MASISFLSPIAEAHCLTALTSSLEPPRLTVFSAFLLPFPGVFSGGLVTWLMTTPTRMIATRPTMP